MWPRPWCVLVLAVAGCAGATPSPAPETVRPVPPAFAVDAELATTREDITFLAGGRTIPGTVDAPTEPGRRPAIVLLAGSGPTDHDWNSPLLAAANGSGKLLAEELARHGAVVVRFDKAGSGKNPPPPIEQWTIDTYRDEGLAALAFVRARADVDPERVFIAGHSEGGLHATRLALEAARRGIPVAGVLYLSSSRSLADAILTQLEGNLANPLAGLSQAQIPSEMTSLRAAFADFLAGTPVDATKSSTLPPVQQLVASLVNPKAATLTRAVFGFDNAVEARALHVPVLVINGAKDIQIDPQLDGKRLADSLRGAGTDVEFEIAPDADHVLKHEPRSLADVRADLAGAQKAYNAEGRTLDPTVVAVIERWLAAHASSTPTRGDRATP